MCLLWTVTPPRYPREGFLADHCDFDTVIGHFYWSFFFIGQFDTLMFMEIWRWKRGFHFGSKNWCDFRATTHAQHVRSSIELKVLISEAFSHLVYWPIGWFLRGNTDCENGKKICCIDVLWTSVIQSCIRSVVAVLLWVHQSRRKAFTYQH